MNEPVIPFDDVVPLEVNEARINAILESGAFEPFEEYLIRMLQPDREADLRGFSSILVTVPKFEQEFILRLRRILDWKIDGHIDGYLACMGALALKLGFVEDDDGKSNINIRRGALAVSKLRASPGPQSSKELDNWITFGLAIMTFAMTALGTGATTVRRHILKHVASQTVLPPEIQYSDSLIPMLVFETWECLLKRSVPLIKLEIMEDTPPVDRLFGLGTPLLPLFYEICQLSQTMAIMSDDERAEMHPAVSDLKYCLERWQPRPPPSFIQDFTTVEVVHLLCQVELHRKAALLFLHRLQYPFGEEDESANRQAREIMSEIDRAQLVTGARVYCIAFPFFLAGVNAQNADLRATILAQVGQHMDPTCPLISKQCEAFLVALWQIRDASTGFFWLDLLKHLPEITMPL